ncbi:potassium transporter Kup [Alsobacter metallidurans]|uniref:potassium transporter Kup n=1 Tax=Alsobacter metallidurans TaxID=340221 RepID=UPI00166C6CDD|nr:potassium transporter Kup [Alsobacter metallidurans]
MSTTSPSASLAAPSPAVLHPAQPHAPRASFWALTLGSVGVVYGDIGTSPLYALKESLTAAADGGALTEPMILGVVSLILWTLIVIVTLKYVLLILSMDNEGEGGTLTLMALVQRVMGHKAAAITVLGMAGAALFYGDAVITPAISVLSAVEGLKLVAPNLDPMIVPLSIAILVLLFAAQSRGTAAVALFFGPITAVWFVAMALGGLPHILAEPRIVGALNPVHGVDFLVHHGIAGLFALGAVFLAVTGAEALYADLGHFGAKPIRTAWLGLVLPSLVVSYLGQGALLLARPEALENPFYLMYPAWALLPMVVLATAATIIASQAVITGAFSITQQAVQLGLMPRTDILRTSETEKGQIYVPRINWMLLVAVLFLVYAFKSSSGLASAYGIAVTGTMVVTAVLAWFVLVHVWNWPRARATLVIAPFLAIDVVFLGANLLKLFEGGWLPVLVGFGLMAMMLTWRRGAAILAEKTRRQEVPLAGFLTSLEKRPAERARGVAVFLTGDPNHVPSALLHNLKHNKVLHERNVILNVVTEDAPRWDPAARASCERLSEGFWRVTLRFGFMETPDVPKALQASKALGWTFDLMSTSFFISRRALRPAVQSRMPRWQEKLFIRLARNASDASEHFRIPSGRTIEVGSQVTV